ncbi:hypothetical protein BsWGS_03089 [Bradybaena similaris]
MEPILNEYYEVINVKGKRPNRLRKVIKSNLLMCCIIVSVATGICVGLALRNVWTYEEYRKIFYFEFPGRLLLNMLKLLMIPLIVSSLITSLANIDTRTSGKLGAAAIGYYLTTTLVAIAIGISLATAVHPGSMNNRKRLTPVGAFSKEAALDSLLDLIRQCVPENIISACFQRVVTQIVWVNSSARVNETDNSTYFEALPKPKLVAQDDMNVVGIVVISIALGCVINYLGEEGRALKVFFRALNSATMILITIVIWYTPVGLVFLVASQLISTKDLVAAATNMGKYIGVVLGGLTIHACVVLPVLFFAFTRKNPVVFAANLMQPLLAAWGMGSSSATLPITMDSLINKNDISANVVRFVVPIGASINMDGTALYEAVACIFIAQINGVSLGIADVIVLSVTATAAAIGAASVPQAGLVTMIIVLTAVGLPTEDVTLILSVDWFLDRFRTAVNVWGDCVGAGILNHLFRKILPEDQLINLDNLVDNIRDSYFSFLDKESSYCPSRASEKNSILNTDSEK